MQNSTQSPLLEKRVLRRISRLTAATMTLVFLATSCTTVAPSLTPGDENSGQNATVIPHGVRIQEANGKSVGVFTSSVEVPAGPVALKVEVDQASYLLPDRDNSVLWIRFQASSGMTYIVTGRRGDGRLCAFPRLENGQPDLMSAAGCVVRE